MIKKIPVESLTVGMYIHDLNCRWIDHNFVRSQFAVKNDSTLVKVHETGVRELYIDTAKGTDLDEAPTKEEDDRRQDQAVKEILRETPQKPKPVKPTDYHQELTQAVTLSKDASQLITDTMNDVRLGKQVELEKTEQTVTKMAQSLMRNPNALMGLGRIRDADQYTFEHSVSICTLMVAFAQYLEMEPEEVLQIGIGSMLHDIGKIKTPLEVLNKPGKLTDEEFKIMRHHVVMSREILEKSPDISPIALAVAAEHHERYDGSGYPKGLKGEEISVYGQMAAIVDVYDAITSDRCYHKGMPPTEALRKIYEWSQFHFNPTLAQQFIRFVGVYPAGSVVELKSKHVALVLAKDNQDPLSPSVLVVFDTKDRKLILPKERDLKAHDDSIVGYTIAEKWGLETRKLMELMI
ncbi:MAG: HD-GYP domain-containing protein [Motiliproteus sp.]|nr:HD-GYP domain-containing protein [Motiliproteus sp.]MCW9054045.1 HD-GYP domain-containing protein [Motiliproteus sp.]